MDTQKTINMITQKIEDGFVVNEHGRWLYMAEQRIYEKRVIEQIVDGNVLVDGKWVPIGEAKRLSLRNKTAAQRKQPPPPPAPVTPLVPQPQNTETISFEAVGDMLETICIDMNSLMKAQEQEPIAENDGDAGPKHVDSVQIYGPAADRSRYAMAYIDELNFSRKRSGMFGKLAKLSIAAAVLAAAVLVILQYID